MKTTKTIALLTAALTATGATAQTAGPKAVYWMSAETSSGMMAGGMEGMMAGAMAGMGEDGAPPAMPVQPATPTGMPGLGAMAVQGVLGAISDGRSSGVVSGVLGNALGGALGGFGRRRAAPAPQPARQAAAATPVAKPANFSRSLLLELGSTGRAPAPAAEHLPPAGLGAGPSLPLVTPVAATAARSEAGAPTDPGQIRGRMLIYWGCGETAPAPITVDFASMAAGRTANIPTVTVNPGVGPAADRNATFGVWPNERKRLSIPASGSLVGAHNIKGNYSPEMRFDLAAGQDFMAPLNVTQAALPSGASRLTWAAVPNATGYFAQTMGGSSNGDMVFWTSSATALSMSSLMNWLPPSEVRRLVASRHVLAPDTTQCVVPSQVLKAASGAMLQMIAYGDEANFSHPVRPANAPRGWTPDWTAKVRFKSTTTAMLGMPGMGG